MLVGAQFKTGSLLKSLHTLDRKLTVTSTTSLRVMNPPISQVKARAMLYFPLNTRSLGRFFGSHPYPQCSQSKSSPFVNQNPSVFRGSDDSHMEDVPNVAISFASSCANVIFSSIVVRMSCKILFYC